MNQPNKPLPDLVEEGFQEFLQSFSGGQPMDAEKMSSARSVWYTACLWCVADKGIGASGGRPVSDEARRKAKRAAEHRKAQIQLSVTNFVAQMQKQN